MLNEQKFTKLIMWFAYFLISICSSISIAAFFIWSHLARIGQSWLFFDSIPFLSLFHYPIIFACVSILLLCALLFLPSLLLVGVVIGSNSMGNHIKNRLIENDIKVVLLTSLLSVMMFLGCFLIFDIDDDNYIFLFVIVWFCGFALSLFLNFYLSFTGTNACIVRAKSKYIYFFVFYPLLLSLVAFCCITPLAVFLRMLSFPDDRTYAWNAFTVIILSVFLIISSLIPGVTFLRLRNRTGLLQQLIITGMVMTGLLFFIFSIVHMVPALILTVFLRLSGIMNLTPYIYGVPVAAYPSEYFRNPAWDIVVSSDGKYYFIKAVTIYSLGDIRLVCPLDVIQSYSKSLRYQIFDYNYDDITRTKLQESVSQCRKVKNQELLTMDNLQI